MPPLASALPLDGCSTEEQLVLVHDHESREMERYRGLALGFLPTQTDTSRLMAALGIKCEIRLASLGMVARHLRLQYCLPAPARGRLRQPSAFHRQLFVAGDTMACQALSHALAASQHSCQFMELMATLCDVAELDILLGHFIEQKQHECRLLEAAQHIACTTMIRE